MDEQKHDWELLAEAASKESDPKKLMVLIEQLNQSLAKNDKPFAGIREVKSTEARNRAMPSTPQ